MGSRSNFWKGRVVSSMLSLASLAGMSSVARAGSDGDHVIALMDEAMTKAEDQEYIFDITTIELGAAPRPMKVRVWIKGRKWRRVEFLAPGDLKGMRVLVRSVTQSYVYLPGYKRVRRVASHTRDQSFMGTAMSRDDMSIVTYGELLAGELIEETETHWMVVATLRPGEDYSYGRIEFDVRKDVRQPSAMRYYNKKGIHVKTETRTNYTCQGKICNAENMVMVDHSRNDLTTEIVRKYWKVNNGVKDSFFTVRSLQRR